MAHYILRNNSTHVFKYLVHMVFNIRYVLYNILLIINLIFFQIIRFSTVEDSIIYN